MFHKLPVVPAETGNSEKPTRTKISAQKVKNLLASELEEIRRHLIRLEEEACGVIPIRSSVADREAA